MPLRGGENGFRVGYRIRSCRVCKQLAAFGAFPVLHGAAADGACRFRHGAFDKPFAHIAPAFDNGRFERKTVNTIAVAEDDIPLRSLVPKASVVANFHLYNHTAVAVVGNVVAVIPYRASISYQRVGRFEFFLADGDISAAIGL